MLRQMVVFVCRFQFFIWREFHAQIARGLEATNETVMFDCSDHSLQGNTINPVSLINFDANPCWRIDNR